jgi:uncharacterized protein (TIGR03084 family)
VSGLAELDLLAAETAELDTVLVGLAQADWGLVSAFKGWRVFDHVHHLNFSDLRAAEAALDADGFRARRDASRAAGGPPRTLGPDGSPDIAPAELLARWREGTGVLAQALAATARDARVPWYGPDMSARAFVVARLMETWAHGQTIHDTVGRRRVPTDRLKPICELGWRTLGWSFRVHGMEPPEAPIELRLTAPSGVVWTWGAAGAADSIAGAAEDFALVICQCRNVADTGLQVRGPAASAWMAIAQCFAGGPETPPAPGARAPRGLGVTA